MTAQLVILIAGIAMVETFQFCYENNSGRSPKFDEVHRFTFVGTWLLLLSIHYCALYHMKKATPARRLPQTRSGTTCSDELSEWEAAVIIEMGAHG